MLKPGDSFERYTVEELLGQGGMGSVYRALDPRLDRRVALKVVNTDGITPTSTPPEATARLLREARSAAALEHPNAVAIYDVGEVDATPYIVMELVPGQTLRAAVSGSAPPRERIRWLVDVARALAAAHKKGLVHRDIKPENVMVRDDGVVKVLDFGIARRARAALDASAPTEAQAFGTLTAQGVQLGTPLYMAPEQIRGDGLDGRADQFAWGVLAYELLTGSVPWRAKNDAFALVAAILTQEVDVAPLESAGAPPAVARVIVRALAKAEGDRFASMDEVARALEPHLQGTADRAEKPASRGPGGGVGSGGAAPLRVPSAPPPRLGSTALQRYSTEDMKEILERALVRQQQLDDGKFSHEELLAAAREVGVEAETLRAASHDLRLAGSEDDVRAAFQGRARRKLVRSFATYAVVITFLFLLNLFTRGRWWIWPAFGWGLAVALQAVKYYFPDDEGWKRDEDKRREKERKSRKKAKPTDDRAIEEAVSILLTATQARGARIATPPARARIAGGAESSDEAAEEEAAAIAEADRSARRRAGR